MNTLDQIAKVTNKLTEVFINEKAIKDFIANLDIQKDFEPPLALAGHKWSMEDHMQVIFIFNTMNFCFWSFPNQPKWTVIINDEALDGSTGLFRLIEELAKKDATFLSSDYLANLSFEQFVELFSGNIQIPMGEERYTLLIKAMKDLSVYYDGRFINLVSKSQNCAVRMLNRVSKFESFYDTQELDNISIPFNKRAQLQVKMINDLLIALGNKPLRNLHKLTAFADYKIPQILRHLNILSYKESLEVEVDNFKELAKDSRLEIEIRVATIKAINMIAEQIRAMGYQISDSQVDTYLWLQSQTFDRTKVKPYHRTFTTAY